MPFRFNVDSIGTQKRLDAILLAQVSDVILKGLIITSLTEEIPDLPHTHFKGDPGQLFSIEVVDVLHFLFGWEEVCLL